MNNDRIQGILFDQPAHIDLAPEVKRQQTRLRLNATRTYIERTRQHSIVLAQRLNPLRAHRLRTAEQAREQRRVDMLSRLQPRHHADLVQL